MRRSGGDSIAREVCGALNYWDSEEEADAEGLCKTLPMPPGQTLGRRANTGRSEDVEQGDS